MLFVRYYLWTAPHVLLALCLVGILLGGMRRRLPIFVAYVGFELIQFAALFTIACLLPPTSVASYRWAMAIGLVISTTLELAVIYELANELLLSRSSLANTLRPLLRGAAAALVLLAALASASLPGATFQRVLKVYQTIDFSSSLIQVGLLITLLVFSRALHISWRNWPTGVALGFGVSACINLAAAALRAGFGKGAFIAVDITQMAAFHAAVLVWLVYLSLPDHTPAALGKGLGESDIQFWDQELQRMVGR